jgi:ferredoxin
MHIVADARIRGRVSGVMTDAAVFAQSDKDGTVIVLDAHPEGSASERARAPARLCPSGALTVIEKAEG